MEVSDWLTIGGWLATFLLGMVATVIVQRINRKRSILAWTVLSENTLLPRETSIELDVPVRIVVDGLDQESLSVVNVRLGSAGTEVIKDFTAVVKMNPGAHILKARLLDDLGEFATHVTWLASSNRLDIKFDYLNPEHQRIDLELLVGGYELGSTQVDLSAPGVVLQRREAARWDVQVSFVRSIALSIMGVRYDPTVSPLTEIADELRHLRRYVGAEGLMRFPDTRRGQAGDEPRQALQTDRPAGS